MQQDGTSPAAGNTSSASATDTGCIAFVCRLLLLLLLLFLLPVVLGVVLLLLLAVLPMQLWCSGGALILCLLLVGCTAWMKPGVGALVGLTGGRALLLMLLLMVVVVVVWGLKVEFALMMSFC